MKKYLLLLISLFMLTGCGLPTDTQQSANIQKQKELDVINAQKQKELDVLKAQQKIRAQEEAARQTSIDNCLVEAQINATNKVDATWKLYGVNPSATDEQKMAQSDAFCRSKFGNSAQAISVCLQGLNDSFKEIKAARSSDESRCYERYK